ncbi:MAG: dual CXXC motif small (seleno)protein [Desulfobacterales bacterium]
MYLHCRSCSALFTLAMYKQWIDDDLEEELADIPCDRL